MIKDVLVNLSVGAKKDSAIDYAIALANTCQAHITAVAFAQEPIVIGSIMDGMPSDVIEAQRVENERVANIAKATFDNAAALAGVSLESHIFSASSAGAADQFGRMARRFDLTVVAQAGPENAANADLIVEAALFQSGRPVIVVPYVHEGGAEIKRVMVCWDGGRVAARAIGDALPLLVRAKAVDVVMIMGEEGKRDIIPGADMGRHLARHGITVDVKRIVTDGDVQAMLLSYAADISADLIVMGGYGHSRLREFILSGVTRGMLASMTVPCLMSH